MYFTMNLTQVQFLPDEMLCKIKRKNQWKFGSHQPITCKVVWKSENKIHIPRNPHGNKVEHSICLGASIRLIERINLNADISF